MQTASSQAVTLRDPELQRQLDELGYVVVDLFDAELLDRLLEIADRVYVDDRTGFHVSNLSGQHEYRHAVNREITPLVGEAASGIFVDYEPYISSIAIKWVGGDSTFSSHQDWNMVDETRFRSVNVFVPLVDMDETNGALRVLPGSHRLLRQIRCSPMPPVGCESVGWTVSPEEMEVVELRRGQALVFDHGILHSSGPNFTERPRWAAITAFKPKEAELFHWYLPDPQRHELEVYSVTPDFFADHDIGGRPPGDPLRIDPFERTELTKDELLKLCGVSTQEPTERTGSDTEESHPTSASKMLRNDEQQAHLDEFGWVVVDLLDDFELERLRQAHAALDHDIVLGRAFAEGFHATIVDERRDYRRASHAAIEDSLARPCERILDGMTLALSNWVHKEPGAAAVPVHADWSFVDEPEHRSLSVWAPLIDTDVDTGCIGVVDRSHEKVRFVRAAAHPGYEESHRILDSWEGKRLIPLRAGQALVYDHRTVHFSQPHNGEGPRVAATCEFVPKGVDLVHFEQIAPGRFRRHHVTPEFFVVYSAGQDPRDVPGHLGDSEVDAVSFDQLYPAPPPTEDSPAAIADGEAPTSEPELTKAETGPSRGINRSDRSRLAEMARRIERRLRPRRRG